MPLISNSLSLSHTHTSPDQELFPTADEDRNPITGASGEQRHAAGDRVNDYTVKSDFERIMIIFTVAQARVTFLRVYFCVDDLIDERPSPSLPPPREGTFIGFRREQPFNPIKSGISRVSA